MACKKRPSIGKDELVQSGYHAGKTTQNKCLVAEAKRQATLGPLNFYFKDV